MLQLFLQCRIFYALEFMRFIQGKDIQIPKDIQIIGFDDNLASRESNPALTTIHQESPLRAKLATSVP